MLLLTLTACWPGMFAVIGDRIFNQPTWETAWETGERDCTWILDFEPGQGEVDLPLSTSVSITLDGEWFGTADIVGVDEDIEWVDGVLTLTPTEALEPNTTYNWWVDTGCTYREGTFTTTPFGTAVTVDQATLETLAWDLRMTTDSSVVAPSSLASEVETLLGGWILGRGTLRSDQGLELAQIAAGDQDFCDATDPMTGVVDLEAATGSWSADSVTLATDAGPVTLYEARINALISPDGTQLGAVSLAGAIGMTPLNAHYEQDYCERMELFGVYCEPCEDPAGCMRVRVEEASGVAGKAAIQAVSEDNCHAQCANNSEECELGGDTGDTGGDTGKDTGE
ncbi:MAG: hypothetical protein VX899_25360 [Myxococcota bacterium]|nr:hypothetical protein [Myxococcota bacterium]